MKENDFMVKVGYILAEFRENGDLVTGKNKAVK